MAETTKQFDMNLFTQALSPLPYAVVNGTLILLTAIETAELDPDGRLMLCFTSGNEMTLTREDTQILEKILKEGMERAQRIQAAQITSAMSQIIPPGSLRRGHS